MFVLKIGHPINIHHFSRLQSHAIAFSSWRDQITNQDIITIPVAGMSNPLALITMAPACCYSHLGRKNCVDSQNKIQVDSMRNSLVKNNKCLSSILLEFLYVFPNVKQLTRPWWFHREIHDVWWCSRTDCVCFVPSWPYTLIIRL